MLIDSGATDNFMDSDMATSRGLHLEELKPPINLCLFDGELSASGKITHYTTNDVKFSDGTTQRIRFLLTKLHETAAIALGLSWLKEVNPRINWKDLCITLRRESNGKIEGSLPDLRRKKEVAPTTTGTGDQRLPSRSARSFTIEVQLEGSSTRLRALIDSGAAENFIAQSSCTKPEPLASPMTLQLFDGNPSGGGAISHHSPETIKLENGLEYKVDLLITQLHPATPLVLGLPWLRKANPDIDWREMSMTMEQGAGLAAISLSQKTQWGTVTLEEEEDVEAPKPANPLSEKQPLLRDLRDNDNDQNDTSNDIRKEEDNRPNTNKPQEEVPTPTTQSQEEVTGRKRTRKPPPPNYFPPNGPRSKFKPHPKRKSATSPTTETQEEEETNPETEGTGTRRGSRRRDVGWSGSASGARGE
ncbi:hypothetical protein D9615_008790 [Tricholomella constricta]|uniref:Peptidase A2 domain-containing protein n=1 Tax=Tricholomella constricta TaxID=117010 RepID=A0A8H5H8E1_9AGAR|nr:hypothetical protein D9615_008790 [Tricholomella constricta]